MLKHTPQVNGYDEDCIIYTLCCLSDKHRLKMQKFLRETHRNKNFSAKGTDAINYLLGYTDDPKTGKPLIEKCNEVIKKEISFSKKSNKL